MYTISKQKGNQLAIKNKVGKKAKLEKSFRDLKLLE
jgi:hypothetical protein